MDLYIELVILGVYLIFRNNMESYYYLGVFVVGLLVLLVLLRRRGPRYSEVLLCGPNGSGKTLLFYLVLFT